MFHYNTGKNSLLTSYKNGSNKNKSQPITNTCDIIHLLHGIIKIIITKLVPIRMINTNYMYKLKNGTNQKKTLTTYSTNNCIGITAKSNITLITFNGRNGKKMLSNLTKKKKQKFVFKKQCQTFNLMTSTPIFAKKK